MDLTLLLLFYLPWVLNLENLDPNLKTLLFILGLEKDKPSHNSIFGIFKQEAKCFWWMMKQDKQTTSQVNKPRNFQNWNTYKYT